MSGLEITGFVPETVETLKTAIESDLRALLGDDFDTSAESVAGAINASLIPKFAQLWELGGITYAARDPANASFASLDAVTEITGTVRRAATKGLVTLTLTVAALKTVPAGSVASVAGQPTNRWATKATVTNSTGSPASFDVEAECTTTGAVVANANTITVIATPVSGWTAVNNAHDAAKGTAIETDSALRLRRVVELSRSGTATLPAITADLADVPNVVSVFVEHNPSAYVDSMGRPPHSVEAVVQFRGGLSGDDLTAARQAFADQLLKSVAGGIATFGTAAPVTAIDTRGQPHAMRWTEPTEVNIYVDATLEVIAGQYDGSSSDLAAKLVVKAFGDTQKLGDDVVRNRILCELLEMPGVDDVVEIKIGTSVLSEAERNITIGPRELAVFDTSRVTITAVPI